jgi:hypothetical protein
MKNPLRHLLLSISLLIPGFAHAAASSVPLVDPAPLEIPADLPPQTVVKAIKAALLNRQWLISDEKPDYIEGTLHARQHTLRIMVRHSHQQIRIEYLDSAELGFYLRGETRYIHPKYKNWTDNLLQDIRKNFVLLQNPA